MLTAPAERLTIAAYLDALNAPERAGQVCELIDGVLIDVPPPDALNALIAALIVMHLGAYVVPRGLGYVTGPDGGYQLGPHTVRIPDAAFMARERVPALPERLFSGAPDLAVEVISPSDNPLEKAEAYLDAGTRLVWSVYPRDRVIKTFRRSADGATIVRTLTAGDVLDGGDALSGFRIPVAACFPE